MPFARTAAALVALSLWVTPQQPPELVNFVFELSVVGKTWDTGAMLNPGVKPPIGKVNDTQVKKVLTGELPDDYSVDFLDLEGDDKLFLFYDSETQWRIGTQADGGNAVELDGTMANDGTFWMHGGYELFMADGQIFATGKVKFEKGTFTPKKVTGTFYFESEFITTGVTLKFKTKGPPLP